MPEVIVEGRPTAEAEEPEGQKKVREQQERTQKQQEEQQKKEDDFVNRMSAEFDKFVAEANFTNLGSDEFRGRLIGRLTSRRTVAAAAKVRQSAVIEQPAEDGRPGVQIKPMMDVIAGRDPASGESMPTGNTVSSPGADNNKPGEGNNKPAGAAAAVPTGPRPAPATR